MYDLRTLADFDQETIALGRARVAQGVKFLNEHFPGWQEKIRRAGNLLQMETHDRCILAIAGRDSGLYTHGDVHRAYVHRGFNGVFTGTLEDAFVRYELLNILWKEAIEAAPAVAQALPKEQPDRPHA